MHQYRLRIIYKPGLDLLIADLLSWQNHNKYKDAEIPCRQLSINSKETTTNIQESFPMHGL